MEPPPPETWREYAEKLPEYEEALLKTELPDLSLELSFIRTQLVAHRTEPVAGISEREIKVKNSVDVELRALVYWPTQNNKDVPVYVLFHPGGWFVGQPEHMEGHCRRIAKEHNLVVFAPGHRRAPENVFPTGMDDVWDWTIWIAKHAPELNIHADPSKGYILAGESPGGNMALVSALRARDDPSKLNGILITGLHLICAQLCSAGEIPKEYKQFYTSYEQCGDAPVFNRKVQDATERYLKPDHTSWRWNPITHPKGLGGLPPTFIMSAGNDPSRDDNLIAEKMMREKYGVKTRLNLYKGVNHLFWINFPQLEVTKRWLEDREKGIKWLLGGGL